MKQMIRQKMICMAIGIRNDALPERKEHVEMKEADAVNETE